ncbi:ATP-binding protein, partial [Desulfotalea psychrophila]|nr:ATP-binding protein [Desulfotalea psychrophila]
MIDVEKTSKDSTPFQSEWNTAHFFAGGGRGAVLKDLQEALADKTELVTLIGEEGSGKTMLCKMLQEQWDTTHKIISMPSVVESFEDVSRVAAQECNMEYPVDANRADAKKIFLDLVESLQSKGVSLLLICDEAEKMYLATLERIRTILDDVNAQGGG